MLLLVFSNSGINLSNKYQVFIVLFNLTNWIFFPIAYIFFLVHPTWAMEWTELPQHNQKSAQFVWHLRKCAYLLFDSKLW